MVSPAYDMLYMYMFLGDLEIHKSDIIHCLSKSCIFTVIKLKCVWLALMLGYQTV